MRAVIRALLASTFLLALAACSANNNNFIRDGGRDGGGGGDGGDGGGVCQQGQWYCVGGSVARQCDGRGGYSVEETCQNGTTCLPVLGCRVCNPGQARCSPDNPQQTQRCADDGMAWNDGAVCDEANGLTCAGGQCQDRCNPTEFTYLGCEYWPTITANSQVDPNFTFAVVVANPQRYAVRMTLSGGALTTTLNRELAPGAVEVIELPAVRALIQNGWDRFTGCGGRPCVATSALVDRGAYHIQANGPIAAYQFNPLRFRTGNTFSYTNDASLLLPQRVLRNTYTITTHENWQPATAPGGSPVTLGSFVSIVGVDPSEVGTQVAVLLTAGVSAGPGVTASGPGMRTFTVRRGQVLQLVGNQRGQDLTGTIIRSDRPVAVFVGHDCTNMPTSRPACDHLEEQLLPNETWGRRYAVTQLRDRSTTERHRVRIISSRPENTLTFEGIATPPECARPLEAGQFCEFETASSFIVQGSQPMLVTQFMIGQGELLPQCMTANPPDLPECMGDPAMVTEVPVDQFRRAYDFLVPDSYVRNFVNIVAPMGAQVQLDGMTLTATPIAIAGGLGVYYVPIRPGRHHIESNSDEQRIGIKVYGVAPYTSYMYPGGLDLAQISPPG